MPPRVFHGPTPPGKGGGSPLPEKQRFLLAERWQESNGNYEIVNPNSGALGAYQVMPANLPGWLAQSGLPQMSAYDYLHNPAAQDRLAWVILGGYYDQYGPAGAAAMWYSGQPDPTKTYGDPPVYVYVQDVLRLMGNPPGTINIGPAPGGQYFNLPPPNEGDWSHTVAAAAAVHRNTAVRMGIYARGMSRIRL